LVWSFIYLALRRVLGLLVLHGRSARSKDVELVVLRHGVQILRRQVRRLELGPADRAFLAAASQVLDRSRGSGVRNIESGSADGASARDRGTP
jgi:putative transposase